MSTSRALTAVALGAALAWAAAAQEQQPPPKAPAPAVARTHLKVGDVAPDFSLPDQNRKMVKLSDYRGKKNVVLAFYVKASTPG